MKLLQFRRRAPGMPRFKAFFAWVIAASLVRVFFRILYGVRFRGHGHVPSTGPLIYVANHQSHFDPPLVGALVMDRPCAFLARSSLFNFKPFGAVISFLNAIPLESDKGGGSALRSAISELEAGRCVLLFPEGTRTRDGALGRFKAGFLLLARRTGAAVVPVAVDGAHDVWPSGRNYPRFRGHIAVKAANAVSAEDLLDMDPDEAVEHIKRTIETMRLELRSDLRNKTGGRFPANGAGDREYWNREE